MSIKAINWALNLVTGVTATQKAILVALADRADEQNKCFPSYDDICHRSCANPKTVASALAKLEEQGFIKRTRRFSKSTMYELLITTDIGSISSTEIGCINSTTEIGSISTTDFGAVNTPKIGNLTTNITTKESPYMSRWSEFWKKYPSKKNKHKSQIAFKNLSAKDQKAAIEGLGSYEFSKDRRYVPMASTWLNGRRWEDVEDNEEIREFEL